MSFFPRNHKIAGINLTNSEIKISKPQDQFFKRYFGGVGLGVQHIFKNQDRNVNRYLLKYVRIFPGFFQW